MDICMYLRNAGLQQSWLQPNTHDNLQHFSIRYETARKLLISCRIHTQRLSTNKP